MDRVHYEKLISTAPFEHIRLTVDVEVVDLKGSDVKELVEKVDKWVELIKRRNQLTRELEDARRQSEYMKEEVERYAESSPEQKSDAESRFKEIKAKEERIVHQHDDWWASAEE